MGYILLHKESPQKPQKTSAERRITTSIPVLMYHYVENNPDKNDTIRTSLAITPYWFEEQLKYLKNNGYETISLNELFTTTAKMPVVLTFDDGYRDFYTDAFPLLKKYKAKATVYIVNNFINRHNYLLDWQLKELTASGLITIGNHTNNHPDLTKIKDPASEIGRGQHFAYPYGFYNDQIKALVRQAGYKTAATSKPGLVESTTDPLALPRLRVGNYAGELFRQRLSNTFGK